MFFLRWRVIHSLFTAYTPPPVCLLVAHRPCCSFDFPSWYAENKMHFFSLFVCLFFLVYCNAFSGVLQTWKTTKILCNRRSHISICFYETLTIDLVLLLCSILFNDVQKSCNILWPHIVFSWHSSLMFKWFMSVSKFVCVCYIAVSIL